jgi:hypothetical protein
MAMGSFVMMVTWIGPVQWAEGVTDGALKGSWWFQLDCVWGDFYLRALGLEISFAW